MRHKLKKLFAVFLSILMVVPMSFSGISSAYGADESDGLKFTTLKVLEGDTEVADLLKGDVPQLSAGHTYNLQVNYNIPKDPQNKPTYLDVYLGNGLYFTSFPGAAKETGPISNTSFDECTVFPNGQTGAPYGYPGDKIDGKNNLKNKTGLAEFKTKDVLDTVGSKDEFTFRVDEAFENMDENQIFKDVIKVNLRTNTKNNVDLKVSNVNAMDQPRFSFDTTEEIKVIQKGETVSNLSTGANSGEFLTEAGSKTTIKVVYPKDIKLVELKENNHYKKSGTIVDTIVKGENKIATVTFDEPGSVMGSLNFTPVIEVPSDNPRPNSSNFEVILKDLKAYVWMDEPNSNRDSSNIAKFKFQILDGESPEMLTRVALTDTMPNWSKQKYDTYNVRLGSMLLRNQLTVKTSPKTLELKIDENNTAIVRGVTIPYWDGIQYGPIEWTSKNGKSGTLTDFSKLETDSSKLEKDKKSALVKNTALGLNIDDSIASIKVDIGEIPGEYSKGEFYDISLPESQIELGKKNQATSYETAVAYYDNYPVGVWGTWKKGTDADVITEAKLYETGTTPTDEETYTLVGKSGNPIVKNGVGSIDKKQVVGTSNDNNKFQISGTIGWWDGCDVVSLQEPVIYVMMPAGFEYSNLKLTNGTLSKPEYIGEFDYGTTNVRVWKYNVALKDENSTNGPYQPNFNGTNMTLVMDVIAGNTARVGTYHINDFIGLTTKDFAKIGAKIKPLRWENANWNTEKYTKAFGNKVNSGNTMASIRERVGVEVKQASAVSARSELVVPEKNSQPKTYVYNGENDETKKVTTAVLDRGDSATQRINVANTVPIQYETNADGTPKKGADGKPIIKKNSETEVELFVPLMTKSSDFGLAFNPDGAFKLPLELKGIHATDNFDIEYIKVYDGKKFAKNTKPSTGDYEVLDEQHEKDANMVKFTSKKPMKYGDGGVIGIEYKVDPKLSPDYNHFVNVVTPVLSYDLYGNSSTQTKEAAAVTFFTNLVNIKGTKTWDDNNNQDGKRPTEVKFALYADGEDPIQTATASEETKWKYEFKDLERTVDGKRDGKLIKYTVKEIQVPEYKTTFKETKDGFDFTNKHEIIKTSVTGTKTWDDKNDQDGKRPKVVTFKLFANEKDTGKTATATAKTKWKYTFDNLDKFAGGKEIKYDVEEVAVDGYTSVKDGFNFTNRHEVEKISVEGQKTWKDKENQDGKRPKEVTFKLIANGIDTGNTAKATSENNWKYTFDNLDKFAGGKEINYDVEEASVDGYTSVKDGYNFTNTHKIIKTSVTGTKTWDDKNDQDRKRPAEVTFKLFANGIDTGKTATATVKTKWKYTFDNLDKFAGGKEINYDVEEASVDGYTAVKDGFNFTNKHEVEKISIEGQKTWKDNDNQDGIRPKSIKVNLFADGAKTDKFVTTDASKDWKYSFDNLDKNKAGKPIKYTVKEEPIDGYKVEVNGYNLTNTHAPKTIDISVTKDWIDDNDAKGLRPESVKIHLFADGKEVDSKEVKADSNWKTEFKGLPFFKDEGKEIEYTIKEDEINSYKSTISGSSKDGFTVTNEIHGKVNVPVTKKWVGEEGKQITINLYADGKKIDSKDITKSDNWKYNFEDLDQFKDGKEIIYTIDEEKVKGYTTNIKGNAKDGFEVTNKQVAVSNQQHKDNKNNKNNKHKGTNTGDPNNALGYLAGIGSSLAMLVGLLASRRKHENEDA